MALNPFSSQSPKLTGKIGSSPATAVVFSLKCSVCGEFFSENSLVIAIGPHHHLLIHYLCKPYFNSKAQYKHGQPLCEYIE